MGKIEEGNNKHEANGGLFVVKVFKKRSEDELKPDLRLDKIRVAAERFKGCGRSCEGTGKGCIEYSVPLFEVAKTGRAGRVLRRYPCRRRQLESQNGGPLPLCIWASSLPLPSVLSRRRRSLRPPRPPSLLLFVSV